MSLGPIAKLPLLSFSGFGVLMKARQNAIGIDTDRSRGHKVRRTAELDIERPLVGTVGLGAALGQVEGWIEQ